MNWAQSLLVALMGAGTGALGAGLVASLFVNWFRITAREGASGYFVVGIGLLGLLCGLVIGLVCARMVAAGTAFGFAKALGVTLAIEAGVLLLMLGIGWLSADFPPRIAGQELVLDVEVSLPPAIPPPDPQAHDLYRWNVALISPFGNRRQWSGPLQWNAVGQSDGRLVVAASVDLMTSDSGRILAVHCADHGSQFFEIPLAGKPTRADQEWSAWLTTPFDLQRAVISNAGAVAVRYRVRAAPL